MEAGSRVFPAALAIDLDQQSGFSRREFARQPLILEALMSASGLGC
jgi:hypothetical protein